MGGVLQYKWKVYCRVSLSSKLRSQESTAIQMGAVLPYKLEVYCRTFSTSCRGWGFRNIAQRRSSEYGFVAYLVERPTRETQAEQYSDTVLKMILVSPNPLNLGGDNFTLRPCGPGTDYKNPLNPKIYIRKNCEKKIKIPLPGVGPENTKKIPRKNTKRPKNHHFCIFSVFFSYFRAPPREGGSCIFFVIFSYFRDSGGFVICTRPAGSQISPPKFRKMQSSSFFVGLIF